MRGLPQARALGGARPASPTTAPVATQRDWAPAPGTATGTGTAAAGTAAANVRCGGGGWSSSSSTRSIRGSSSSGNRAAGKPGQEQEAEEEEEEEEEHDDEDDDEDKGGAHAQSDPVVAAPSSFLASSLPNAAPAVRRLLYSTTSASADGGDGDGASSGPATGGGPNVVAQQQQGQLLQPPPSPGARRSSGRRSPLMLVGRSPPASPRAHHGGFGLAARLPAAAATATTSAAAAAGGGGDEDETLTHTGLLRRRLSSQAGASISRATSVTSSPGPTSAPPSLSSHPLVAGTGDATCDANAPPSIAIAARTGAHTQQPGILDITQAWLDARAELSRVIHNLVGPVLSDKTPSSSDGEGTAGTVAAIAAPAFTSVTAADKISKTPSTQWGIPAWPKPHSQRPTDITCLPGDKLVEALRMSQASREALVDQFLRARHGSAPEAAKMMLDTLQWRARVNIPQYLTNGPQILGHPNAHFPMRVLTDPRKGHKQAVVYGLLRLLDKRHIEREPFTDAVIAFFENLYFNQAYPIEPITVIIDLRGWSVRRHTPYRVVKDGLEVLQSYYPDRLGRVFLVNYSSTLRAAYAVISPIIDPGARDKVLWVSDNPQEVLAKYLPAKSIPIFLGGQLDVSFPGVDLAAEWKDPSLVETGYF